MVTIKPKTVVRMHLAGEAVSHFRTNVTVRDLATTIDEPEVRGGTNKGLSPTEP
jgi:putative redox protein